MHSQRRQARQLHRLSANRACGDPITNFLPVTFLGPLSRPEFRHLQHSPEQVGKSPLFLCRDSPSVCIGAESPRLVMHITYLLRARISVCGCSLWQSAKKARCARRIAFITSNRNWLTSPFRLISIGPPVLLPKPGNVRDAPLDCLRISCCHRRRGTPNPYRRDHLKEGPRLEEA
jgi:hypothetical protein